MPLAERQLTTRVLLKEAVYLLHAHPELNTLPNTPHITIDQDTTSSASASQPIQSCSPSASSAPV